MSRFAALLLAGAPSSSCATAQPQPEVLPIEVLVESDSGRPLPGVPVYLDGATIGESDLLGRVATSVETDVRRQLTLTHRCPETHDEVERSRVVRLRRFRADALPSGIRVRLRCRPSSRRAVFVVRAKNGPQLRVRLDGRHVATTNSNGVVQFSRRGSPGTEYLVELDSSDDPTLRPSRTAQLFVLPDSDEIFIVDQAFRKRDDPPVHKPGRRRIIKIE